LRRLALGLVEVELGVLGAFRGILVGLELGLVEPPLLLELHLPLGELLVTGVELRHRLLEVRLEARLGLLLRGLQLGLGLA